jgi:hypothetical protein
MSDIEIRLIGIVLLALALFGLYLLRDKPEAAVRMSHCTSCGRNQPSDPSSKYFSANPDREFDSDWDGCVRGMGT